jgi:outer membrane protein with beta-barrel domain
MRTMGAASLRSIACLLLLTGARPASAEWVADLYGGGSYTPRSDFVLVVGSATGPADHTFHDVEWQRSGEYGARAGYWLDAAPWYGLGIDLFRYDADVPRQTVDTTISGVTAPATLQPIDFSVVAVAFEIVRLRYPLFASAVHPKGRLQPYVTAGPALFRVTVTNRGNGELTTRPASDTVLGYKAGAGLTLQITKDIGVFGEFRYTHFRAEPALQGTITGASVPIRFDLDTRHLVAGVSVTF